jgi:Bacterial regulatory proteins, luxR family
VLSRELGISASVVTAKRNSLGVGPSRGVERTRKPWSKTELAMLGKKPDTWVAQKTGRGRRHVRAKRESLGIPPFQTQNWVEWNKATVAKIKSGKLTNAELARELGVSEGTVALHRRRMLQKDRRRR